jgi:hypothetical protein
MKPKVSANIVVLIFLIAAPALRAVDKTFTSSGQILPGEEWGNVYVYNDDTVVDMLGGILDSIVSNDASTLNVFDGEVSTLAALEFSTANIFGGSVHGAYAWDQASVTLSGTGTVLSFGAGGSSGTVNMLGGVAEYVRAGDTSVANLYGGLVNSYLNAWDSASVNIYGYDFDYDPAGGNWNGGQLTGFWLDHTPFTIDLYDTETYGHVNLVPEPSRGRSLQSDV